MQYISQRPDAGYTRVDSAKVHYLHWQNPGKPGLLFVHGHAAHAHWWDFIAPAFTGEFDVVAIDLTGSGDSDHRVAYSAAQFAGEIAAVTEAAGLILPVIVGHSFGGTLTRIAAHLHPDVMRGIIIVDSLIPDRKGTRKPPALPSGRERTYASLEEGKRRFRLKPPQPGPAPYILDHIAGHSLRPAHGGFQFKLDQGLFAKMPTDEGLPVASDMVRALPIPVGFIYGEKSRFFPPDLVSSLTVCIAPDLVRGIADAHHHVFLDQPLEFISVLGDLTGKITRQD